MSTLTPIYSIYFSGRRPSKVQITNRLLAAVHEGHTQIEISWGENMIEVGLYRGQWLGYGWIKTIGGDDLVKELVKQGLL